MSDEDDTAVYYSAGNARKYNFNKSSTERVSLVEKLNRVPGFEVEMARNKRRKQDMEIQHYTFLPGVSRPNDYINSKQLLDDLHAEKLIFPPVLLLNPELVSKFSNSTRIKNFEKEAASKNKEKVIFPVFVNSKVTRSAYGFWKMGNHDWVNWVIRYLI